MNFIVNAPVLSPNDQEVYIAEWLVDEKVFIKKGTVIALIEDSKSTSELMAEAEGYFYPIRNAGEKVNVQEPIAVIMELIDGNISESLEKSKKTGIPENVKERRYTKKAEILLRKNGLEINDIPYTDILIREKDVREYLEKKQCNKDKDHVKDMVFDFYELHKMRLLIIGGGAGAVQVLEVVQRLHDLVPVGIVDDGPGLQGKSVMGVPVLGPIEKLDELWLQKFFDVAIISVSTNIDFRSAVFNKYFKKGIRFGNVIDPTVLIHSFSTIGTGNVIMANSRIGQCTKIGNNNFISSYVNLEHHNVLGDGCTFGPGVMTSGYVNISDRVKFGTGVFIEPNLSIGSGAIITSGTILTQNIKNEHIVKAKVIYTIQPKK